MVDIFLSYKSEERGLVEPLNDRLYFLRLDVFFDVKRLDSDDYWARVIDKNVKAAKAVIGCWAPGAHGSPWVQKECILARELQTLIPAMILPYDETQVFIEFIRTQRRDLTGFAGEWGHVGFHGLLRDIGAKVGRRGLEDFAKAMAAKDVAAAANWADAHPEVPLADDAVMLVDAERRGRSPPITRAPEAAPAAVSPQPPPPSPQAPLGPVGSPAALAFARIEASLDPHDYADFLTYFPGAPEGFEAAQRKRRLEAWAGVAKSDPEAIEAFLRDASFPALEAQARSAMQAALAAQKLAFEQALAARRARENAEAEARQVAEEARLAAEEAARKAEEERREKPRRTAEAAKAGRPISERAFAIELPGVSNWPDPQMIAIPPGRFLMGAAKDEKGASEDEFPQHEVTIHYPFAMGQHAVTFAEWDAALTDGAKLHKPDDQGWGRGNRPVIKVSWEDAQAYLAWLNERCGAAAPGPYRLPSEAEWEYACRAGTDTPFSFGETISTDQANYDGNYTYGASKKGEFRQKTMPVGSFPANEFGLHDMHGNVWEWVEDCYTDYRKTPKDGSANTTMGCLNRASRGGSWLNIPQDLRSANRFRLTPTSRLINIGFRLSRTL